MAWGKKQGVDDLAKRVANKDPSLKSLHVLRLRQLDAEGLKSLALALEANPYITEFYASGHKLCGQGVKLLSSLLAKNTVLQSICVGDEYLGDSGVEGLCEGLLNNQGLRKLDLVNKGITAEGARHLSPVLERHPALQTLLLSRNVLGDAGLQVLLSATPWPRLTSLDLNNCNITHQGIAALSQCLSVAPSLVHLALDSNPLGADGGQAVAALLGDSSPPTRALPTLRELSLADSELGDAGVAAVLQSLAGNTSLQHLNLSRCHSTAQRQAGGEGGAGTAPQEAAATTGVASACLEVAGPCALRSLVLAGNSSWDPACVKVLTDSLAQCGGGASAAGESLGITSLDLSEVQIDGKVLDSLSRLPALRTLCLVGCVLGSSGASTIARLISLSDHFAALQDLMLSGCGLELGGCEELMQAITNTPSGPLKSMELGSNPCIQSDNFEALVERFAAARPDVALHWRAGASDGSQ